MGKVNYDYEFEFISKIEHLLKYSYKERSKFMNTIISKALNSSKKRIGINKEIEIPDTIEVPKEYFKYIENTQRRTILNFLKIIKKEFKKQYKEDLKIISYPIKRAYFEKESETSWIIKIEIKGLCNV